MHKIIQADDNCLDAQIHTEHFKENMKRILYRYIENNLKLLFFSITFEWTNISLLKKIVEPTVALPYSNIGNVMALPGDKLYEGLFICCQLL